MEEENTEVLFESWGFKHAGTEKKKAIQITSSWKKQYFILFREDHVSKVFCYDKKPKNVKEKPKAVFDLFPEYSLRKQFQYKNKPYACVLVNRETELCAGFEEEKIFHLFCFFVQTQTHLREECQGESFVLRPDSSDGHRKLGSRGNMCLLHISQWGVVLALQLSRCVLAHWPLKAIKWYESSGRQQFGFEAGRKAPMGAGTYIFNTRPDQDNMMYDKLDSYVMEAAGFKQFSQSSTLLASESTDNISMTSQLTSLQSLTTVYSDERFTATLKRISRDIYDHLSQHLGGSVTSTRAVGTPSNDLTSDGTFTRSKSSNGSHRFSPSTPNTPQNSLPQAIPRQISHPISPISHSSIESNHSPALKPRATPDNSLGAIPMGRPYENDFIERESLTARKIKEKNFSSSYLAMNTTTATSIMLSHQAMASPADNSMVKSRTNNNNTTVTRALPDYSNFTHNQQQQSQVVNKPKVVPSSPKPIPRPHGNQRKQAAYVLAKRVSDPKESASPLPNSHPDRLDTIMAHPAIDSYSPVTTDSAMLIERQKRAISNEYTEKELPYVCHSRPSVPLMTTRPRLQSQSLEDFSQYERMSNEDVAISNYLYHNRGFRMSDEVPSPQKVKGDHKHSPGDGIYSYASPSALHRHPPRSPVGDQQYNSIGDICAATQSSVTPPLPALRTVNFLEMRDIYAKPLPRGVRRSRSIPNLSEIEAPGILSSSASPSRQGKVSFENNNNTIKYFHSDHQEEQQAIGSPVESLAFANNMFKEELDSIKHSPAKNVNTEDVTSVSSPSPSNSPSKPSLKPKPMLSLFKREPSRESSSSSITPGIRSMSTSPISPFPSTLKSPGPGVKGITFTPKTKSFKRPQADGGGASSTTDRDSGEISARRVSGESVISGSNIVSGEQSLKRRTGSSSSVDRRMMEGRRLPSLPPDAILSEDVEEMATAYAKVEETLC